MIRDSHLWWYVARSAGIVAWLFAGTSVLTGLVLSSRAAHGARRPNWQLDLHRHQATLSLAALGLHIGALMMDSYVHFGILDVLVPGRAAWKPWPVSLGIVALYLLIAVEVTSLLRRHISKRVWKAIHFSSLGVYLLSTAHFLSAGTDRRNPLVLWSVLALTVANVVLLTYRILTRGAPRPQKGRSAILPS
jgi:methionine sulfoxide reductase heme-binding subunit